MKISLTAMQAAAHSILGVKLHLFMRKQMLNGASDYL